MKGAHNSGTYMLQQIRYQNVRETAENYNNRLPIQSIIFMDIFMGL